VDDQLEIDKSCGLTILSESDSQKQMQRTHSKELKLQRNIIPKQSANLAQ
jgi:hypothetical protein